MTHALVDYAAFFYCFGVLIAFRVKERFLVDLDML